MGFFFGRKDLRPPTPRKDAQNRADWPDWPKSVLTIEIAYIDLPEDGPDRIEGGIFREAVVRMSFKNGKVGERYCAEFRLSDVAGRRPKGKYVLENARGFKELGLICRVEGERLKVEGTPIAPFKGVVKVYAYCRPQINPTVKSEEITVSHSFNILSNPFPAPSVDNDLVMDPDLRSIERDLPVDKNAPFQKEDRESYGEWLAGGLVVIAASEHGHFDSRNGNFRSDRFLVKTESEANGWLFFAVADGAWSAKHSYDGSKIACEKTYEILKTYFSEYNLSFDEAVCKEFETKPDWKSNPSCDAKAIERTNVGQFFYGAVYTAWNSIKKLADIHEAYSTTLLFAAVKRFPKTKTRPGFWAVASYWVGDGGAAVYRPNGTSKVHTLGLPDGGEFAGQTRFLTMNDEINPEKVASRVQLNFFDDFQALVLMTDGISDPFFPFEADLTDKNKWKSFWEDILPNQFPGALDTSKTPAARSQALLEGMDSLKDETREPRTLLLVINDCFVPKPEEENNEDSDLFGNDDDSDVIRENYGDSDPLIDLEEYPDPIETQLNVAEELEQDSQLDKPEKLSLTIGAEFWDPQASVVQLNVLLARIEKMQFDPGTILKPYSFSYKLLEGDLSHTKVYIKEVEGFCYLGLHCEIDKGVLRVSGARDDGKTTSSFDGDVQIKLTAMLEFRLGADQLIQKVFNFNRPKAFPAQTHFKDLALTPKPFYITPASDAFYQGSLRRLPVYILLDTSRSMRGEPIEAVKVGLQTLLSSLRRNPYALETVWLSIISYDVNAKVLTPLTELSEAAIPPLSVHQTFSTNLGEALTLLMKRVDREVRRTTSTSKGDWKPILIVMTDGEPSDTLFFERAASTVKAYPFARIVACCAGSRAKVGPLRLLTDDIYSLGTMDAASFSRFWDWVSSCVSNDSTGGINLSDDGSELPPPPPEINIVL